MKKIVLFFFFVVLLASCQNTPLRPEPPPFIGKMSVVINGKKVETENLTLFYYSEGDWLVFQADLGDETLAFTLNDIRLPILDRPYDPTLGTHTLGELAIVYEKSQKYTAEKGEWRLESRKGRQVQASFWAEAKNSPKTETVLIENGTIEFVLPENYYK